VDYRAALLVLETDLGDLLARTQRHESEPDPATAPDSQAVDNSSVWDQSVRRGVPRCAVPIQHTNQTSYVTCNDARASQKPSANADEPKSIARTNVREDCLENKHGAGGSAVNADLIAKLTPERLKNLASEDFAMYLDAMASPDEAILLYLREIGINLSAWEDAIATMGWLDAFISLIIIDRNRYHPDKPVFSPGGALRRFTDLHRIGRLNLTQSIVGLLERDRAGIQPRGPETRKPQA
jgi:replication initiation protein RepC